MGILDELTSGTQGLIEDATNLISGNKAAVIGTAAGVGALGVAGAVIGAKVAKKRKARTKRGRSRDRKFISKQKHERRRKRKTPGRVYKRKGKYLRYPNGRKKTKRPSTRGGKRVFYTKRGQPYIKLKSGKARFVKKSRR